MSLYRAVGVEKRGKGGGVDGEDITVHLVPSCEVATWLRQKAAEGVLIDFKIWAGLYFVI